MIRNITIQSIFQIALLVYLLFLGAADFGVVTDSAQHTSIVFTTFVLCQLFNEINARSIDDCVDVFKGLFQNPFFGGVLAFTVIVQYTLIESPKINWLIRAVSLPAGAWYKCTVLAALSLPLGGLMRFVPVPHSTGQIHQPSPLLSGRAYTTKGSDSGSGDSLTSLSFILWCCVCIAFTALFTAEFGEVFAVHLDALAVSEMPGVNGVCVCVCVCVCLCVCLHVISVSLTHTTPSHPLPFSPPLLQTHNTQV